MAFTALERDVLQWVADRAARRLAAQLRAARCAGRKHTGVGLFVELDAPSELTSPWFLKSARTVNGPEIESPALRHGAGTLVSFDRGRPRVLEIFTYDDPLPEELDKYALQATTLTSPANLKYDEDDEIIRSILYYQRELLTDREKLALPRLGGSREGGAHGQRDNAPCAHRSLGQSRPPWCRRSVQRGLRDVL